MRPRLIYITPLMPRTTGNGLAMRAGAMLEALAQRFEVHLFVVPVAGAASAPDAFVSRHTARATVLDTALTIDPLFTLIASVRDPEERARRALAYPRPFLSRACTSESGRRLLEWYGDGRPAAVQVMRLYLAPVIDPFLRMRRPQRPFCVLDLDDDEALSHERLAALYEAAGDPAAARTIGAEAPKYRTFASRYLPAFDRVGVCSAQDATRLAEAWPDARFAVLPNTIALPNGPARQPVAGGTLRLLFVGTLGYFPNADAARFLCRDIVPALRRLSSQPIVVALAGAGDTTGLRDIAQMPEVALHGYVEDLAPLYAAADIAVVPLRAGGGTRIKILEAFAHGVPVVATRLAAEGIEAVDNEHLLLADNAEDFARACLTVAQRPDLTAARVERAARLVATRYSPAQSRNAVSELYADADLT